MNKLTLQMDETLILITGDDNGGQATGISTGKKIVWNNIMKLSLRVKRSSSGARTRRPQ